MLLPKQLLLPSIIDSPKSEIILCLLSMADCIARVLRREFSVIIASSEEEALARITDSTGLVITDEILGGEYDEYWDISGVRLARGVLALCPRLPILFAGMLNDVEVHREARR